MTQVLLLAALLACLYSAGLLIGSFYSRWRIRQLNRLLIEAPYAYKQQVDQELRKRGMEPLDMSLDERFDAHLHRVTLKRYMRSVKWPVLSLFWLVFSLFLMLLATCFV